MRRRVVRLAIFHDLRGVKPAIRAEKILALRIEPGQPFRTREVGVMIAPFAVFGFVVDHAVFDLNLAGIQIPLEIGHVVVGIPQVKLHQ